MENESLSKHASHSSLREKIVEHLFVGEVLRTLWERDRLDIEVLKSEFDAHGYDIVLSVGNVCRYIQLKAGVREKPRDVSVSRLLEKKIGGCVVWISVDHALRFNGFYFFGNAPDQALSNLEEFKATKHAKANSEGVKTERQNHRRVPISKFAFVESIERLLTVLFPDNTLEKFGRSNSSQSNFTETFESR